MTNQWKRTLTGIVVLAMLLSCAAVNVFAATSDLTENDFTLSVDQTGTLVTVKLTGTKEVTGWCSGSGTLSVANAAGTDAASYFTLNSLTTKVGDPNNTDSDWKWAATSNDETNGDTITANTVWAEYSFTVSSGIPAGSYTFSMTFGSDFADKGLTPPYDVAGKTITATYDFASAKGYTVTLTDGVEGTAEINPGASFDMNVVVSGAGFNGMQAEIGYDATLFTLNSVSGAGSYDSSTAGAVSMYLLSKDIVASGETVATLSFTAVSALPEGETEKTGSFTIAKGTADDMAGFATQNAVPATLIGDAVKVAIEKTYTVTVDSAITHGSVGVSKSTANAGDPIEVTVSPDTGYTLDTLTVKGDVSGTDVTVTDGKFTMPAENVTVSATFTRKDYTVTLNGDDLSGATTANYGTAYVATVANYAPDTYNYTLAVTIGGTEYTEAAISTDGKITIPGEKITGSIVIALTKALKPFTVTTADDYVTGAMLVLVTGTNPNGYTYSGNPMFYMEKYSAYAYVVDGAASGDNVAAATSGTPTTIPTGYDVNGTGKVDFNDAGAAFGCYNKSYTVADNVALYLRADVDGSKKVDSADVSAIMSNYTPDSAASTTGE